MPEDTTDKGSGETQIMFNHLNKLTFPALQKKYVGGTRYYEVGDRLYPSITSILSIQGSEKLDIWRKQVGQEVANYAARLGANRGTAFHKICADYLSNRDVSVHKDRILPFGLFNLIKPELDRVSDICILETALCSHRYQIAGQVDCIASFDGKLSVIDLKSANRAKTDDLMLNHSIQETGYAVMWDELTGRQIRQIVTVVACENGESQVSVGSPADHISELERCINEFQAAGGAEDV